VDPSTGKLATHWCPLVVREAFLASTEPQEPCPEHSPREMFRSIFRRFLDTFR
jgi:hypothetical protein